MRLLLLGSLVMSLAVSTGSAAPVGDQATDGYELMAFADHYFGHNHFWVRFEDADGPVAPADRISVPLRVWVTWIADDGPRERFFSTFPGDDGEPLYEGPFYCDMVGCMHGQATFIALPHDFGGVYAVVEIQGSVVNQPPCVHGAAACVGPRGYVNQVRCWVTGCSDPHAFQDAADALPQPQFLL